MDFLQRDHSLHESRLHGLCLRTRHVEYHVAIASLAQVWRIQLLPYHGPDLLSGSGGVQQRELLVIHLEQSLAIDLLHVLLLVGHASA